MCSSANKAQLSGTSQKVKCDGWVVLKATLVFMFGPDLKTRISTKAKSEQKSNILDRFKVLTIAFYDIMD